MKPNVGKLDRVVRIALGIGIAGAGFYFQSWLGAIAIIPLGTALMGTCPLYTVLGLSTCPLEEKSSSV